VANRIDTDSGPGPDFDADPAFALTFAAGCHGRIATALVITRLDRVIQNTNALNAFLFFRVLFLAARKEPKEPRPAAWPRHRRGFPRSKNFAARK